MKTKPLPDQAQCLAPTMIMISDKQLEEFMHLYRKRFGKPIERKDALVQAEKLLRLVQTLMHRPR